LLITGRWSRATVAGEYNVRIAVRKGRREGP